MSDNLETIFQKYKYDKSIADKSKSWFQQQQLALSRKVIEPKQVLREQPKTSRMTPGKLYMFTYDPKHKATLPYYDAFPLVFPYQTMPDGFMGLNMHYLPYFQRIQLMTRLMQFSNNKTYDENTRIKYSWSLIAGLSRFKLAESCVKHYLKDHVTSMFIEIPGTEWHTAMMLPVEKFVGSNKNRVWGESLRK